jgi:membrane-associated phospholipid phosphatase
MNTWWTWGLHFISVLQGWGSAWTEAMMALSFLGSEQVYMFVLPAVLWCVDARLGIRLGLALLGSGWLNSVLKLAAGLPRPYWVSQDVSPLASETSYGMPSGHAQTTTAVYGTLARGARRPWILAGIVALLLLIGLSRLALGVHFPLDVLAGWLVGLGLLWLVIRLEAPALGWLRRLKFGLRLSLPFLLSLVMLLIGLWARSAALDRMLPQEWVMNAMRADPHAPPLDPRTMTDLLNATGAFFGFGTGAILLGAWGRFDGRGRGWNLLGRFALGLVGSVLFYYGLKVILPSGDTIVAYVARYARYAAVGFWLSYLAPRAFVWSRLA